MGTWTWFRGGRRSKNRHSKHKEQETKSTEWESFEALAKANRYEEIMQILESIPNDEDDDDINDKLPDQCGSESGEDNEDNSTEAMSASSPSPSSKNSGTGSEKEHEKLENHMIRMRDWMWESCRRQEVEEVPEMPTTTCTCFPQRRSEGEKVHRETIQASSDETPLHRIVRFRPPVDIVDGIVKQLQTVHALEHHVLPDTLVPEEVTDAEGRNALHVACAWNAHFTVIQRLVAGTSAIMPALRKDQHGRLPLHYFCCEGTDLHPKEVFKRTKETKNSSRKSRYLCKSEKEETINKISQPRQEDIPPLNFSSDEDAKENRWLSIYILILAYPQGAAIADVDGNTPFDLAQGHSCPDRRVTALLSRNSKRHAPPKLVVPARDDAHDEATIAEAVAGLPLEIGVLLKGKQIDIQDDDASYNDDISSLGRDFELYKPHSPAPLLMPVSQPEPEEEDRCPLDAPLVA